MPSGAKKRKAAKKKKEKEANTKPSASNPEGNDDLKSQDEKGSDGGEDNSPAYHDHEDHHHPFHEGSEEVEEGDPSATQSSVSDVKSMEEAPGDINGAEVVEGQEDSVVKIERELKSEDISDRTIGSVEHEESHYGNGNSGGTSNVESHNENNSKDEPYDSKQEAIPSKDLIDSVYASPTNMSSTTEKAPVEETSNLIVEPSVNSFKAVASACEVKSSDDGSALLEKSMVSLVAETDLAMKKTEDKVFPLPDQHIRAPNSEEPEKKEYDSKVSTSLSDSPAAESTENAVHIKDSDTPECSENQVASAPHMVQKTSWLNCCGLFQLLSGSDR